MIAQRLGKWEIQRMPTKRLMWNPPNHITIARRLHSFTCPAGPPVIAMALNALKPLDVHSQNSLPKDRDTTHSEAQTELTACSCPRQGYMQAARID